MVLEVKPSETVTVEEGSEVVLKCAVYGYPRNSSPLVWTWSGGDLQSGRFTTSVTNARLFNDTSSISSTTSVASQLTINCPLERFSGEYTCSVQGNSTSVTVSVENSTGTVWECMSINACLIPYICCFSFLLFSQ